MPPQQYEAPNSSGQNYDFIMNPGSKPPKPNLLGGLGGSNSMAKRIGVVVALLFVLVILLAIVLSIFSANGDFPQLLAVSQDQNELVRVATLATTTGQNQSSQTTLNFAESARFSLTSEQQQLLAFMGKEGKKPSTKQLAATKDTQTDTELNNSIATSSFNTTFLGIMQTELKSYEAALDTAFQSTHNLQERQLLSRQYKDAQLLLKQLNSPTQ